VCQFSVEKVKDKIIGGLKLPENSLVDDYLPWAALGIRSWEAREKGARARTIICVCGGGQMSTLSVVVCIDKMQRGLGAGLAKMTFNKSHLGISMVTRGHFITVKFFLWGHRQGHGKGQLPPSGTTHATYDWQIRRFWSSG